MFQKLQLCSLQTGAGRGSPGAGPGAALALPITFPACTSTASFPHPILPCSVMQADSPPLPGNELN